jgi:hypothetical protein
VTPFEDELGDDARKAEMLLDAVVISNGYVQEKSVVVTR